MLIVQAGPKRQPFPPWVTLFAIALLVLVGFGGIPVLLFTALGDLPFGAYHSRLLEQGDIVGYIILWIAAVFVPLCALAKGRGGIQLPWTTSHSDSTIVVFLLVLWLPASLVGLYRERDVLADLRAGPASIQAVVTSFDDTEQEGTDSHGNSYTYTNYRLTIGGLTFGSSASFMGAVYDRATQGHCALVTYGAHSHILVDVEPCRPR